MTLALAGLVAACAPAASTTLPVPGTAPLLVGAHNDTSTPFNLVSVPALDAHRYDGRGLRITDTLARQLAFTRYAVSYRSGPLTVTGVMVVPNRSGRHPVVVIAHGYGDPARYTTGSMLEREQAMLAENGFVAFQIDYRNYAGSTRESTAPVARPLGYPADLVNAVAALKKAHLSFTDTTRIGLFGRSMGGGVVLNALVARPHLAQAAVLYSPVSSLAADNYRRWVADDPTLRARVVNAFGTPQSRPRVLAPGQLADLPRPRRRPDPDQPRHRRPGLPGPLERGHHPGSESGRQGRHALRVPRRGPPLRPLLGPVHAPLRRVPAPRARLTLRAPPPL